MWIYPRVARVQDIDEANAYLKVARHSPCVAGASLVPRKECPHDGAHTEYTGDRSCTCAGFVVNVPLVVGQGVPAGKADLARVGGCARCGHSVVSHGRLDIEQHDEYVRRVKAAIRIDELLEDDGKLLDFGHSTDDTRSLRLQVQSLCYSTQHGNKNTRKGASTAPQKKTQSKNELKKARKNNADQTEPGRVLPNAEMYETLNYMYQRAHYLAVQEALHQRPAAGSTLCIEHLLSLAKRSVIRLDPAVKRSICMRCHRVLIEGLTASTQVVDLKRLHKLQCRCVGCGHVRETHAGKACVRIEQREPRRRRNLSQRQRRRRFYMHRAGEECMVDELRETLMPYLERNRGTAWQDAVARLNGVPASAEVLNLRGGHIVTRGMLRNGQIGNAEN